MEKAAQNHDGMENGEQSTRWGGFSDGDGSRAESDGMEMDGIKRWTQN